MEETDYETLEKGKSVSYTAKSLADWINFYIADWREYGDIPKDTPPIKEKDIPSNIIKYVENGVNGLEASDGTEDSFEEGRSDILIAAMKKLKLPIPKGY